MRGSSQRTGSPVAASRSRIGLRPLEGQPNPLAHGRSSEAPVVDRPFQTDARAKPRVLEIDIASDVSSERVVAQLGVHAHGAVHDLRDVKIDADAREDPCVAPDPPSSRAISASMPSTAIDAARPQHLVEAEREPGTVDPGDRPLDRRGRPGRRASARPPSVSRSHSPKPHRRPGRRVRLQPREGAVDRDRQIERRACDELLAVDVPAPSPRRHRRVDSRVGGGIPITPRNGARSGSRPSARPTPSASVHSTRCRRRTSRPRSGGRPPRCPRRASRPQPLRERRSGRRSRGRCPARVSGARSARRRDVPTVVGRWRSAPSPRVRPRAPARGRWRNTRGDCVGPRQLVDRHLADPLREPFIAGGRPADRESDLGYERSRAVAHGRSPSGSYRCSERDTSSSGRARTS